MVESKVVLITPELAQEWLKKNTNNRRLKERSVDFLAEEIRNGSYELNGESICFSESGQLKDGQHRLAAIVKAGIPVKSVVVTGISDNSSVYDRGVKRSLSDTMKIEGWGAQFYSTATIAFVSMHFKRFHEHDYTAKIPDYKIKEFINNHLKTVDEVYWTVLTKKHIKNTLGIANATIALAIFYALEYGISHEVITRFVDVVNTGLYSKDSETSAIYLRNKIIALRTAKTRLDQTQDMIFTVEHAIEDFANGIPRRKVYGNYKSGTYSTWFLEKEREENDGID